MVPSCSTGVRRRPADGKSTRWFRSTRSVEAATGAILLLVVDLLPAIALLSSGLLAPSRPEKIKHEGDFARRPASKLTMPHLRLITVAVAAGALVLLLPAHAQASSVSPVPMRKAISDAPAVCVGEVVDVTNQRRWAKVAVEEVWKGPDLPSQVLSSFPTSSKTLAPLV